MMNPIIASLSELTKMFAELLRFSSLFPALVFILLNRIVILPHFASLSLVKEFNRYSRTDQILAAGVFALFLGYIMSAVGDLIIQLFKGKIWKETWFGAILIARQNKRKKKKKEYIRPYHFPSSQENELLPTTLGNIIAAYEDYPEQTYNMNTEEFWPRIHPILVKNNFFPYIAEQRSPLDFLNFLLNASLVLGIFCFECLMVRVFLYEIHWVVPLASFVLSYLFYQAAINRAEEWGKTYRAAFDLYRYELADALGLKPVKSFINERIMWTKVSELWSYQPDFSFDELNYSESNWPVKNSDK